MNIKEQVFRLLSYKNLLYQFQSLGFVKVFSDNIAESLEISSSLVRKDFSHFGITGNQKGGYHIETVLNRINEVLGSNKVQKVIIVGVGRIGGALLNFESNARNNGIKIVAGFDINQKKINRRASIPILPIDEMTDFIKKNGISIAIVAVPGLAANHTIEMLKDSNIRGILNFTPIEFKSTEILKVNNINIENELENLTFFINQTKLEN